MKKFIFTSRHLVIVLSLVIASLCIIGCQSEDIATEDSPALETVTSKQIPLEPDFIPPNIPNPSIDVHCVVRLAYLSYLERCPENASVVSYWTNIFYSQGFEGVAVGFISSPEASQRWNSRYHSFLNRNNLTSYQIDKKVYIAYQGLLLREPDVNGGTYWTNQLRSRGLNYVARAIGSSPEFERRLANISTECNNAANQCTF
ncbi:uncharacterized protein DUF4214 [Kordia periserrulae]|uniref:Uncharacterized protein DUF4214 n=1 Tax=Kordia periserrulae TaxID=701523 RepID=A0A2T6BVV6_9FLAO|nr:DUF4214 domain-containing protein [Kordia periserrulae]PTX60199.1 uncharacterized protein DUF4214 [Kordia periserrulae]